VRDSSKMNCTFARAWANSRMLFSVLREQRDRLTTRPAGREHPGAQINHLLLITIRIKKTAIIKQKVRPEMDIEEIIDQMNSQENISIEDIPSIDLYMDQVIQLFEKTYSTTKRNETEKILTKTMINNYAKGKLFFPVKNKKYSKEHIILISLIYQLKGGLSIGDIKTVLDGINEKMLVEELDLEPFYQSYLNLHKKNINSYKEELRVKANDASEELAQTVGDTEELEKVLLIASLVNMSNLYRRTAEKLVDTLKK